MRGSVIVVGADGKPTAQCGDWTGFGQNDPQPIRLTAACPRAFLALVYASAPGYWAAGSDGDYLISFQCQGVVLSNGFVDLGVNAMGNLLQSERNSLRLHNRPDTESVQNGCRCEGWGIGVPGGDVATSPLPRNRRPNLRAELASQQLDGLIAPRWMED